MIFCIIFLMPNVLFCWSPAKNFDRPCDRSRKILFLFASVQLFKVARVSRSRVNNAARITMSKSHAHKNAFHFQHLGALKGCLFSARTLSLARTKRYKRFIYMMRWVTKRFFYFPALAGRRFLRAQALSTRENVSCENWNIAFLKFAALAATMHAWETALGAAPRHLGPKRNEKRQLLEKHCYPHCSSSSRCIKRQWICLWELWEEEKNGCNGLMGSASHFYLRDPFLSFFHPYLSFSPLALCHTRRAAFSYL